MQALTDIGKLIVHTPGTYGGRPRIADPRITVQYIVNWECTWWQAVGLETT